MSILNYLRRNKKNTAAIAKERLQIIISHERSKSGGPDYLPLLQKDLVKVIGKYVEIEPGDVNVSLDRSGGSAILELNITLPESESSTVE